VTFTGWKPAAIRFLTELDANNDKEWWTANKHRYDADVYAPMAALGDSVADTFGELRVKRPHRDTRFSADKSPYKTTIAGGIDTGGGMLLGVQLATDGLTVVAGHFEMAPDQLDRFRAAVDDHATGAAFERIVQRLDTKGYPLRSLSRLKGVPRGFTKDHPRAALLSYKGIHIDTQFSPKRLPSTVEAITTTWTDAAPFLDFMHHHVGHTTMQRPARP
jgi:uncharacterized protein (TIGR02453 family)